MNRIEIAFSLFWYCFGYRLYELVYIVKSSFLGFDTLSMKMDRLGLFLE